MRRMSMQSLPITIALALFLCADFAAATTIQDLVRIKGHERNVLTGMGIVVGLNGTGDQSKDSYFAARPYAELLKNLGNPVLSLEDLEEADAYALVSVTMEIPPTGVREGDRLDVHVDKLFNAESLEGGRLVVSLLRLPGPDSPQNQPLAFAEGQLVIEDGNPAGAIIRDGGQMLADIRTNPVARDGSLTLVLKNEYAGYPIATTVADIINQELGEQEEAGLYGYTTIATVEDAKNIRVQLSEANRDRPAQFIASLMTRTVDPSFIHTQAPARIVINEQAGIIGVTGNVEIGPVAITHKGMQLTNVAPVPGAGGNYINLDTTDRSSRTSTGLLELLQAFDQLKVPVEDQIAIIHELKRTGALHAEIVTR